MKLTMVANGSQKTEEKVQLDTAKSKESTLLTEEKLYSSDIFRMFCYKVRVSGSVSSRLLNTTTPASIARHWGVSAAADVH